MVEAPRRGRRLGLRRGLFVLLVIVLAVLVAGRLGAAFPLLDLANLALVPAAIAAIVLAAALAWLTLRWTKRAAYALVIVAAAVLLIPPSDAGGQCSADAPRLRVAWLNLQGSTQPAPILAWLEAEQVEVAAFGELHESVEPTRSAIFARFPHWQSCLPGGACSTVIAARQAPLSMTPLSRGDVQNRKSLSAARMIIGKGEDAPLRLVAVHLSRAPHVERQRGELARLQVLLESPADTVVIGDFNMVRRMRGLANFARDNGFRTTVADRATWPLWWQGRSIPPVIQIDHVLAGRNWRVESLRSSGDLGSDHRGIVAQLCRAN